MRNALKPLGIGLFAVSLLVAGCTPPGRGASDSVPSVPAERTTLTVEINEIGVVESTRVVQLQAPYSARIIKILENGTPVKKGDVVVVLDTREQVDRLEQRLQELRQVRADLESTVENLRMALRSNALDLSSSQAQLDLQRVQLEQVNLDLAELEFLRSRQIVPEDDVRSGRSRLRNTQINTLSRDMTLRGDVAGSQSTETSQQIQLERIGLRGEKATARLQEAQQRIELAEITSPVDGMFLRHSRWNWQLRRNTERENGESVREGEVLGQIPDLTSLIVRSQIPESEVLRVSVGASVQLTFEALGNLRIPGRVTYLAPLAIERETSAGGRVTAGGQELTGERVFEITVEMERLDSRLKPGLTARTRIEISREENLLTVPLQAIQTTGGRHFVNVRRDRKTEQREVTLGQANNERVEVISGLTEGELVLLAPVG